MSPLAFARPLVGRRSALRAGLTLVGGAAAAAVTACGGPLVGQPAPVVAPSRSTHAGHSMAEHMLMAAPAEQAPSTGVDPTAFLETFDYGKVSRLPDGRTLREFELRLENRSLEIAKGVTISVWTFNGQVPGPTLRVTAGDRVRVTFHNGGDHLHGVHFHGIHAAEVDGGFESVAPKGATVYEFDADPFGMHLYHCHTAPLAKHIARGLFGAYIVDPPGGRPPVDRELVMMQHGWDVDGDGKNELYSVNGPAFAYNDNPIKLRFGETVRIYLANVLEFDPVNSFHLHANFFQYYPTGTSLTPAEYTDTIVQGQGQRGIVEFSYRFPGRYMFHAHKTEFAELGWTGVFDVA